MENNNNNQDKKKENPYTPGVNPFTNQAMPANPPTPAFNPQGETKPPLDQLQPEPLGSKPAAKLDFKIVFLYIILAALGGVAAKYSLDFFAPKKPKPSTPQLINVNSKPASQPLIKFVPGKQAASQVSGAQEKKGDQPLFSLKKKIDQTVNPYTLSGIFFSGNQNYCIINDKVLGEGDSVEGARVTRISTEDVELQLNDKTIKLNLRGK
ncbi:MAG: hypothetical protein NTY14_00245 [Candidatus Omnitrophica bacterium]|nr:hypothetical protein [Candidatus Omnitrophota bacterium]